jgi:hypothetical protein
MPPLLEWLDPSDPPPRSDEPRFGNDQATFRRAYKSWHKRETTRRNKAERAAAAADAEPAAADAEPAAADAEPAAAEEPTATAAPQHPKPRGQVPRVDGEPCNWDGQCGCWRRPDGQRHEVNGEARRAAFFAKKKAEQAEEQKLRYAISEEIDAEAKRRIGPELRRPADAGYAWIGPEPRGETEAQREARAAARAACDDWEARAAEARAARRGNLACGCYRRVDELDRDESESDESESEETDGGDSSRLVYVKANLVVKAELPAAFTTARDSGYRPDMRTAVALGVRAHKPAPRARLAQRR